MCGRNVFNLPSHQSSCYCSDMEQIFLFDLIWNVLVTKSHFYLSQLSNGHLFQQIQDHSPKPNSAKGMDMEEHPLIIWLVLKLMRVYMYIYCIYCWLNPSISLFVLLDKANILTLTSAQLITNIVGKNFK